MCLGFISIEYLLGYPARWRGGAWNPLLPSEESGPGHLQRVEQEEPQQGCRFGSQGVEEYLFQDGKKSLSVDCYTSSHSQ